MSVRIRIFLSSITAILVINAVSMAAGFLLFYFIANPYSGQRLRENIGYITARYFTMGGLVMLLISGVGALWIIAVNIKRVTSPLERLKQAVSEIREGNLDFELVITGNDEFTELGTGFEQMRIRLKNTIGLQERAETERRLMMASITHDLQTPITSIIGYSEGILDGVASTPDRVYEYVNVIIKKAKSLKLLAEDLSLLSKLENASLPLEKMETDIGEFLIELISEFKYNEPNMVLETQIKSGFISSIDREKLARVFINILENSVKYTSPEQSDPKVEISLSRQNGDVLIKISDNGIGISHSDLPYVFDDFYRADASRTGQSGSGLGLSIARHLVTLHNGKIWIINNPDRGISVNITLPLLYAPPVTY
ncbi:MAG: HAMP domain-containing histidine kinase [Oscillospiraceae bacterium]|nr:HAMP domain-containing histidine kinase [Oscillospiraceae bacterium]